MEKSSLQQNKKTQISPWIIVFILLAVILGNIIWQLFWIKPVAGTQPVNLQDYSAAAEIETSLRNLKLKPGMSEVLERDAAPDKKIALTFDGMLSANTMMRILDLLEQYNMSATFFVSGLDAVEDPEVIKAISEANHEIGNYTLRADKHMEEMSREELVEDFCCANKIFSVITEKTPAKLKCNVTEYTEGLLEAAFASGLRTVVKSSQYLTYQSFSNFEDTQAYVDKLPYKSIVSIKLSGVLDKTEYTPKEVVETPAIDKQPDVPTPTARITMEPVSDEERLLRVVEWLLIALNHTNFSPETELLRTMNSGKLVEPIKGLWTTDPSVAFTFYGLGRMDELAGILSQLEAAEGVGMFFVTSEEIQAYPDQIQLIIEKGHVLGIAVFPKEGMDFHAICFDMLMTKNLLEEQFNYKTVKHAMQPWGVIEDDVREAASALNCILVSHDMAVARDGNKASYRAEQIEEILFGENDYGLKRGQIICFRMNYFDRAQLIGDVIKMLNENRNVYSIRDVSLIINNFARTFTYPLPKEKISEAVRDKLHTGQLNGDVMELVKNRYIGNKDVNTSGQLPGFSSDEIRQLDTDGRIKNDDNAVFLTFDDWGTDMSITKLLDVLRKYGVKATFFVRTRFVVDNPSLLRAIAAEGHEIASHTHNHLVLAHDPEEIWSFTSLSKEEAQELQRDIVESYKTLQSIVGDMWLENGRPALSTVFRPPTLAVSKIGIEAAFDCGLTYIVSGSPTTQDYKAASAEELYKTLKSNIKSGSVVVMHMSPNSIYTAEALDMFFAYNEQQRDNLRFTFARVSDYLDSGLYETPGEAPVIGGN